MQKATIESLNLSVDFGRAQTTRSVISSEARTAFVQVVNDQASLEESLRLLKLFFLIAS